MQFHQVEVEPRHGPTLRLDQWQLEPNQSWVILGGNGSGKSALARLLNGDLPLARGEFRDRPARVHWLSLESQQALYERELYRDETDFSDHLDPGTSVRELLEEIRPWDEAHDRLVALLKLAPLLDRGYRLLSSGEGRKVMLARAVLDRPDLLLLDEPFEGLDRQARLDLIDVLGELANGGQWLMMLIGQRQDVPPWATHLALLDRGQLMLQGTADAVLNHPDWTAALDLSARESFDLPERQSDFQLPDWPADKPLVELHNGRVEYATGVQFEGLDWQLRPGEHTQIHGPNGCGKSTLLSLVSCDHPQCYANNLTVFGYRRGQGESIWDIKKHLGLVSGHLHRDYRVAGNALTAVVSGLTDSIGVYKDTGAHEAQLARQWLDLLGLADKAGEAFKRLSTGEQRLVLIARALIKQPPLLILDEPTQGLDDVNRFRVLAAVERILEAGPTTLLFVSHRDDEQPALIRRHLRFSAEQPGASALFRITTE
ncbi:ATP-binding cassette domain-containing protein [Saccharospirillum mangrovi]|uniref:ATP-binding cassette domain-containing protein n=1 Tax=Saccharospirillum mangrovi TaxID=2161747 RepID=UPI000D3A2DE4|nr:ATP-binding cassette domain-containing protein [Saccharospirillum mangrovi]